MHCYLIKEMLLPCDLDEIRKGARPYVIHLTESEWFEMRSTFGLGIDFDPEEQDYLATKATVNYDSITGTFSIPRRIDPAGPDARFSFALDERGIIFIDGDGVVAPMLARIALSKRWHDPSLGRFLYDALDGIVSGDQRLLENYEQQLVTIEDEAIDGVEEAHMEDVTQIRRDIRALRVHYEQLLDLAEVLEENENGFFPEDSLRYFRVFANRIMRLRDTSRALSDFTIQVLDAQKTRLDIKQNNIITVLTVVTTVFTPLTLITGWYGMNFFNMPELTWKWGYPMVILVCLAIAFGSLAFFRYKKWL